jgi:hypothetical protein
METNNPQKQAARNLFLHTDKTRAEIADMIDINTKTLYLWIKHGRWEEMKTAARQTPASLLQDVYDHIEAINNKIKNREDRCPTYQEVEMLRKLFVTTKHVQKLNLGTYVEAFTELTAFINDYDHDLGKKVVMLTDKYIKGLAKPLFTDRLKNVSDVTDNLEEMKKEEEKDIEEIKQADAAAAVYEPNKTEKNTAIFIPMPVVTHSQSNNPATIFLHPLSRSTTEPITPPAVTQSPTQTTIKSNPSFFTRPPLAIPPALRPHALRISLAFRSHNIGHNRAFLHYLNHSKSTNKTNSMPDENLQQSGHD